jgi:hypothetical protein
MRPFIRLEVLVIRSFNLPVLLVLLNCSRTDSKLSAISAVRAQIPLASFRFIGHLAGFIKENNNKNPVWERQIKSGC